MDLVLKIEFLTGVCRATRGPGDEAADWPPQPDRVFSALVSAWAVRGELNEERAALEWLEAQPVPDISASGYTSRTSPDVFVPPNDPAASNNAKKYIRVMPDRRPRQPRRFPVAWPEDPNVRIIWPTVPGASVHEALNALASCVGYVGHSTSLARCRFSVEDSRNWRTRGIPANRNIYPGRLGELEAAYRSRPHRPVIRPGAPVYTERLLESEASADWLILEVIRGKVPDIRAAALVCRLMRHTLMAGYQKAGRGCAIPEEVSGHLSDGKPTRDPHLTIVPMPFVGSHNADGRVLGLALIPPLSQTLASIEGFRDAFEAVAQYRADLQRRVLRLEGVPLREPLWLSPAPEDRMRKKSLLPDLYIGNSRYWASVTPIVLDRHLKRGDESEIRELIANACRNSRLPCPDLKRIRVGKHSSFAGVPPARPSRAEPPWARWKVPDSFKSRTLVHAAIDFEQKIDGPVLLGAGRFTGLGLCRALGAY